VYTSKALAVRFRPPRCHLLYIKLWKKGTLKNLLSQASVPRPFGPSCAYFGQLRYLIVKVVIVLFQLCRKVHRLSPAVCEHSSTEVRVQLPLPSHRIPRFTLQIHIQTGGFTDKTYEYFKNILSFLFIHIYTLIFFFVVL